MNRHLVVYEVTREYGGSEEGGWWYNQYTRIDSLRLRHIRNLKRFKQQLEDKHANRAYGNIYHSTGGVEIRVCVSKNGIGEIAIPMQKPYYE